MENKNPAYTITFEGKTYIYVDLFEEGSVKIPIDSKVTLLEKGSDLEFYQDCNSLTVSGKNTYAVFVKES